MAFIKSDVELKSSVFQMIGKQWLLISAGTEKSFNSMTASWGAFGVLWNKYTATVYVRPERYTYGFLETNDRFSLCLFGEKHREALVVMGTKSGRDMDKPAACGLSPVFIDGVPAYAEAETVFICKKIYSDNLRAENMGEDGLSVYAAGSGIHKMYIGEILGLYRNDARQ
ncbi:MAG: flavin reductase family protein [Clostridiales bacterium]|nr:flavin reductase family protein [Clostridiales bacterium]